MISLTMKRGSRHVFIGLFPSKYRAEIVAYNLGWSKSWKSVIKEIDR